MTGSSDIRPAAPSGGSLTRRPAGRLVLPAVSVAAALAAMVVLTAQASDEMLAYGVGVVPDVAPWLAAILSIALAVLGLSERWARSAGASVLMGALIVLTAWSVVMLPFDLLRIVGLVPLPLSGWGMVLRLLLLIAGASAVVPVLRIRRAHQERCAACGRALPGPLDRLPRWPAVVAVVFALPYPVLRVVWALGGTFGLSAEPMTLDPAVAWGAAAAGWALVAFTLVLLIGKGPRWARALFGLGGLVAGTALAAVGGLAAARALTELATNGFDSSEGELMTWTFVVVYGSWFVAGLAVLAASWRYWARRREGCPACGPLLGP